MKKTLLLLSGLMLLASSCSKSSDETRKESIKVFLDKNAKDPKSYELVELKIFDTVTPSDVSKFQIEKLETENLRVKNEILNQQNKLLDYQLTGHNDSYKDLIKTRNEAIKTYEEILSMNNKDIEKAKKNSSDITPLGYIYLHKYRLKNGFGALDLSSNFLSFNTKDSLVSFNETPDYLVFKKQLKK